MNLVDLELRRTTKCTCGEELSYQNVLSPLTICEDHKYYGGRVKKYATVECKNCHNQFLGLIDRYDTVFDTMILPNANIKVSEEIEEDINNNEEIVEHSEKTLEELSENTIGEIKAQAEQEEITVNEEVVNNSDKFVCPKCGREFKTNSGLATHCRSCVNK